MKIKPTIIKYLIVFISVVTSFTLNAQTDIEFYNQGEILRYQGEYLKAEQAYLSAIEINPNMFDAHIELAIIEYDYKKNYDNAINYLDYCLQNTKDADLLMRVYFEKGIIYSVLNEDKKSLKMFNKGISINGVGEYKALLYAGRGYEIHYFSDELNNALADFEESIKIHPTYEAFKARGELFYSIENYEDAEKDFTKALSLDGDENILFYYRGKTRYWDDKNGLALKDLERVNLNILSTYSEKYVPDYLYYLGATKYYLGNYEESVVDLKKSILIADTVADVYHRLGRSYLKLKKYKEAITTYETALTLVPESEFYNKDLGICYRELKEFKKSEFYLDKAIKINIDNSSTHKEIGLLKLAQEDNEGALKEFTNALELIEAQEVKSDGLIEYYRAKVYIKLGDVDKACVDLKKSVEFGNTNDETQKLLEQYCK